MIEPYRNDAKRRLPTLEDIGVATPCNMRWDAMTGHGRIRFCGECKKNVFDISGMTRADAESLIYTHFVEKNETCVRLYKRDDGTVLTDDCPVGLRAKTRRRLEMAILAGGILALLAFLAMKLLGQRVSEAAVGSMSELK